MYIVPWLLTLVTFQEIVVVNASCSLDVHWDKSTLYFSHDYDFNWHGSMVYLFCGHDFAIYIIYILHGSIVYLTWWPYFFLHVQGYAYLWDKIKFINWYCLQVPFWSCVPLDSTFFSLINFLFTIIMYFFPHFFF